MYDKEFIDTFARMLDEGKSADEIISATGATGENEKWICRATAIRGKEENRATVSSN